MARKWYTSYSIRLRDSFLWMNVWVWPPVAAVDSVKQARLVTVSMMWLCTSQTARCCSAWFTWQAARLSAACLLPACVGQSQELLPTLLHLSFSYTLPRHTVMVSFFPLNLAHTHFHFFAFHSPLSCADQSSIILDPAENCDHITSLQTYCTSVWVCVWSSYSLTVVLCSNVFPVWGFCVTSQSLSGQQNKTPSSLWLAGTEHD